MMREQIFVNGEYYHIYNRGVDKRRIFLRAKDYQRFLNSMLLFNDEKRITDHFMSFPEAKPPESGRLVRVLAYCLMPNHFHLMLQQIHAGGVSKYLQKLLTGYTMYFNKRYERSGILLQGVFKSKHISNDSYLLHLSRYIHLNPLDLMRSKTNDKKIVDRFLSEYKWSSYSEYLGLNDSNRVIDDPAIVTEQIGDAKQYRKFVSSMVGNDKIEELFRRFRLGESKAKSSASAKVFCGGETSVKD